MRGFPIPIKFPVIRRRANEFVRSEDGAALVEFAVSLPMMLLLFAVIIEGGRLMISYQSTISGALSPTQKVEARRMRDEELRPLPEIAQLFRVSTKTVRRA